MNNIKYRLAVCILITVTLMLTALRPAQAQVLLPGQIKTSFVNIDLGIYWPPFSGTQPASSCPLPGFGEVSLGNSFALNNWIVDSHSTGGNCFNGNGTNIDLLYNFPSPMYIYSVQVDEVPLVGDTGSHYSQVWNALTGSWISSSLSDVTVASDDVQVSQTLQIVEIRHVQTSPFISHISGITIIYADQHSTSVPSATPYSTVFASTYTPTNVPTSTALVLSDTPVPQSTQVPQNTPVPQNTQVPQSTPVPQSTQVPQSTHVPGYPNATPQSQSQCGNYGYCNFIPTPVDLVLPTVAVQVPTFLVRQDEIDLANRTIQMYKFANSDHLVDLVLFVFISVFALAMLFKLARDIGKN